MLMPDVPVPELAPEVPEVAPVVDVVPVDPAVVPAVDEVPVEVPDAEMTGPGPLGA